MKYRCTEFIKDFKKLGEGMGFHKGSRKISSKSSSYRRSTCTCITSISAINCNFLNSKRYFYLPRKCYVQTNALLKLCKLLTKYQFRICLKIPYIV